MDRDARLATLVQHYRVGGHLNECGPLPESCEFDACEEDLSAFRGLSFAQALRHAFSKASPTSKAYRHQQRIPAALIEDALARAKLKKDELQKAGSFAAIHEIVAKIASQIKGLGPLFSYDVATRLGAACGQMPSEIYLHAGTLEGARHLLKRRLGKTIRVDELPTPLRVLSAAHLENFLCIYKDCLKSI